MFDVFYGLVIGLFNIIKIPLIIVAIIVGIIVSIIVFYCVLYRLKGIKPTKCTILIRYKKRGKIKRIFIDFPKQYAYDFMTKDYDRFGYKGIVVFTGRQGNGKTIAMSKFIQDIQLQYPKCKVITNYGLTCEDDTLIHWKQLLDYNNDKYGVCVGIDEMQNWLGTFLSRNFPPEMLAVATQNRKNSRIICGTAQSFHLLAKTIRSQCTEVRECRTLFGCITIVRRREPVLDSEGNVIKYNNLGMYFFVHSNELRASYDTYKVISSLSDQVNNMDKIDKSI